MKTTRNALLTLIALATAALGLIAPGAGAQEPPKLAGTESLFNFEHVANFQTTGTPTDGRATDLEFYTSTVALRDEAGNKILDENGQEIMVERDFAIMGSYPGSTGGGAWVYDITDPENARFVVNIDCRQSQNDVQIKKFGERWILALAKDGSGNPCVTTKLFGANGQAGIAVYDVTDPYEYEPMFSFRNVGGAHNFTFHPTKPFGAVSTGDLPGLNNHIPIIDFTDLDNPKLASDISNLGGPHDIAFNQDGSRMYVASENNWKIYDTTDLKAPVMLSQVPNAGTYAHGFDPTPDEKYAIGTNESLALGGFFVGGTAVCPGEGLTIFDVSDKTQPTPVGQFMAPVVGNPNASRACTGHVGEIAPNGRVMVTGWYSGGARVLDFSNPSAPVEIGHAVMADAEVWTANFYKGPYMYTADQRRGFDIFKWTGGPVAPWQDGFTPSPTTLDDVSVAGGAGSLDISGAATFGGEHPVVIAEDGTGDGPIEPGRAAEDGLDLTAGRIYRPAPDADHLVFEWDTTKLPTTGSNPEATRYTFPFDIGGKSFQPQAKLTNVASVTLADDAPSHARTPAFQLRGNCVTNYQGAPLANCPHVAWLDGQFDVPNSVVRLYFPIDASFAPEMTEGAVLNQEVVASATISASYQAVATLNGIMNDEALWEEGVTYTVPGESVSFAIASAGTPMQLVQFEHEGEVAEDGTLSGSIDTSGLSSGAYDLYVKACFSNNCDMAKLEVTL